MFEENVYGDPNDPESPEYRRSTLGVDYNEDEPEIEDLTATQAVQNGIDWLDRVFEHTSHFDWSSLIDLKTLDVARPEVCVCGQIFTVTREEDGEEFLYYGYELVRGLVYAPWYQGPRLTFIQARNRGFTSTGYAHGHNHDLQLEWEQVIAKRQGLA